MEKSGVHSVVPKFSVVLIMIALSVVGIACLPRLNVQYTPSESGRTITVSYSFADASAEIVEAEATSRIEGTLSSIQGVSSVNSLSSNGSGRVSVEFRKGKDMDAARFEVASAIRNLYPFLPTGVTYPLIRRSSSGNNRNEGTAISYTIKGDMPSREIERFAREHILTPISTLRDVDAVSLSGATPFHWVIVFDAMKAASADIDAGDIASAFSDIYRNEVVGTAVTPEGGMVVRLSGDTTMDFGSIPIKNAEGRVVRLGDIASWRFEEAQPNSYYRVNGLNTINLSISVAENSNLLSAVSAVKEEMSGIAAGFPEGVSVDISYDSSEYIRDELRRIYFRTGLCILILLLFVFIVSRSWRYMLIITATLAVNILTAVMIYAFAGVQIHIYTFAGITVSLGMVIDTSIVMADHYGYWRDRRVFPSIFAATATTVGALLLVLLLPESERANLNDFIRVIVINLALSLAVAYYFIPSLMGYIPVHTVPTARQMVRGRRTVLINRLYAGYIEWGVRHRWLLIAVFLACFCIPARLFYSAMDRTDFYRRPVRPQLYISAGMPEGSSIVRLNEVVKSMENYLAGFDGIESFRTVISRYDNASIVVDFKPEVERTAFPQALKSEVTAMAANFGGANWTVSGIDENDFDNNVASSRKSDRIILSGYNFQELMRYAGLLTERLAANERVVGPEVRSSYNTVHCTEFNLGYDFEAMTAAGVNPYSYYSVLSSRLYDNTIGQVMTGGEYCEVVLRSSESGSFDLWHVLNTPLEVGSQKMTLSSVGGIEKKRTGIDIKRENQSYVVEVCFDVIGSNQMSRSIVTENVGYMNDAVLPVGFKARDPRGGLFTDHKETYGWLVLLILAAVFIMLSMTFESLRLPFAVILLVPISFIGVFLVFGLSDISFDQGGFAALVMLCGIVVNAGIYIITTYQRFGGMSSKDCSGRIRLYIKAFNHKAVPTFLTIASTALGLLPFLSDGPEEVFWFDFAVGTICGLLMSVVAILLYLPVFAVRK
ncbi:MAG: efflux RND transporter permease subunit [Bacteroidales bacterium]|nr:efflux RND transporter permease subunit [Bacteroidales bacterium]